MSKKKKVLLLTVLLLISGFSSSLLLINTSLNDKSVIISDTAIKTSAVSYDWVRIWSSSQTTNDDTRGIAINSSGKIIVGGKYNNQDYYLSVYEPGGNNEWNKTVSMGAGYEFNAMAASGNNIYVLQTNQSTKLAISKYNETKTQEWNISWQYHASSQDYGYDIVLDATNFYVAGSVNQAGNTNGLIAKFDLSGSEVWNTTVNGTGTAIDRCLGAIVNGSSIYVVGRSSSEAFLAKHSITDGSQDWNVTFGYAGTDWAQDVVVDTSGNIYVTGVFQIPDPIAFLAKFNSSGHQKWNVTYNTTTQETLAQAVAIDLTNNYIYVAGIITIDYYNNDWHALQLKYDVNGNLTKAITWKGANGGYGAEAKSITVDTLGNVYLVGANNNSEGYKNAFVLKNLVETTDTTTGPPPIPGFEFLFILVIMSLVIIVTATKKKKLNF